MYKLLAGRASLASAVPARCARERIRRKQKHLHTFCPTRKLATTITTKHAPTATAAADTYKHEMIVHSLRPTSRRQTE